MSWQTVALLMAAAGISGIVGCVPPPTRAYDWAPKRTVLASDEVRVPFRLVNGMPYVSVDIGRTTASFLLDTGSDTTVVLPKLAEQEEIGTIGTATRTDTAGVLTTSAVSHLLTMTMGGVRFDDLDTDMTPLHLLEDPSAPADVGGLLGWPAFTDVLLTIDYANRTLIIRHGELPAVDGKEILPMTRKEGGLSVPASLNATEVSLLADTGASRLSLSKQDASGLKWRSPLVPATARNWYVDSQGEIGRAEGGLQLGRYVVRNPVAYVDGARDYSLVGESVLSNFVVTFDLRNMRLRLERSSEDPIDMPGIGPNLTFGFSPADHQVTSVEKGGVAERAGVHVGDEVVSMNGQPISGDGSFNVNWPENQPLRVDLKRDGQPIHVELDIKPLVR